MPPARRKRARLVALVVVAVLVALTAVVITTQTGQDDRELTSAEKRAQAIADGNVALCNNGDWSDNTNFGATCSGADGLTEWLAEHGECQDGYVIKMAGDSSCADHGGFKGLLPEGFRPLRQADDVARCRNGSFSNNTNFSATCSGAGGIHRWLGKYGECEDGTIIEMSETADCSQNGGFKAVKPADYEPPTTTTVTTTTTTAPTDQGTSPP